MTVNVLQKILTLIDLTRLNENDNESEITLFCEKIIKSQNPIAAVCIYPQFISRIREMLRRDTSIKIATVINFPKGLDSLGQSVFAIREAIRAGANEIDVVFPYTDYMAGRVVEAQEFVAGCKQACGEDVLLKVILETGALQDPAIITTASKDVLRAGADFLKTSTGTITVGATPAAARSMLLAIQELTPSLKRPLGLKVSGGIRRVEDAVVYLNLADEIMGLDWVSPGTFRFGTSQLLDDINKI